MREMKDSGIPWIGEIPKEWEMRRGKFMFNILSGAPFESNLFTNDSNYMPLIRIRDIMQTRTEAYYMGEYTQDYVVTKGDILVGMDGDFNVAIWKGDDALLNQRVCKLHSFKDGISARFIYYSLPMLLKRKNDLTYATTVKHLSTFDILSFLFLLPPLAEQQRIAEFLDKKCAEVDEMIGLQEQIIEELKAYKQSVITEAVTKGLNPDAPMRDSGIEWIGQIPEHWVVAKLNYFVSKIGSGSTPKGGSEVYANCGVKFLRSQNIYFDGFRLDEIVFISDEIDESMKGTRVLEGDVLLNITGGSIGRCYYVDSTLGRANVNQHVSIVRPSSKTNTKYLKYYLQSEVGQIQIQMLQTGGNREGLSAAALKEFRFLYLPLMEQQAIADYLDEKCADIDSLIQTKQAKIDSLKEYKKSIIYEYVTGKREVE